MHVIKTVKPVQDHQVIIDLPYDFLAQEVEVFIIPYQPISSDNDGEDWKQDFRSISQWDVTEDQMKISSWPIEEF